RLARDPPPPVGRAARHPRRHAHGPLGAPGRVARGSAHAHDAGVRPGGAGAARGRAGRGRGLPVRPELKAAPPYSGAMHLAQLNIGRLRAPLEDPRIDGLRTNLERINALAEASPGFVWRLQDESGDATGIKVFDDDLEIINLTVWT